MNEFPRRFGSYVLLKPLARGGMGALYLALSSVNDDAKLCVIKTVLPHLADKEYLQRFRDEAKVVVRLAHQNLVPVFDSGQAAGVIYLAMDYIDGRDLRATWNRCAKKGVAFPVDVAAYIVKELARGLHYAHGFGDIKLVHRDVSPPNVLLSYAGEVRLTDFGLASSTLKLEKTAPGIIYGKVSYMSPEQARGETLDGRTDLYASGIILWELLTGRQLFPSGKSPGAPKDMQTSEELLRRVRSPEMVPPSRRAARVPPELDRIALKALAPDLKERYANCEELRHELATFLARTSPSTDSARVSTFLKDLYAEDMEADRREREKLIAEAREWYASGGVTVSAPPPIPSGPSQPETAPLDTEEETGRGRTERGTMISGPARHDRALNKRRTPTEAERGEESAGAQSDGHDDEGGDDELSTSVIGTVVGGRYYVRKLLGEGGMGRVYEAEHIDIGRRVALKILHPAYSQTPDLVERLRREARAASKISHPNVIDVTDSGTTPAGAFFFVMEFLQGIELGELIYREKKLDVRRTLHIGAQICRALQAAHEVNVIHRDLKPENVLVLTRDGKPDFIKVLDFGIAKSGNDDLNESQGGARRLTHPGMTMGTPEYMAPEQAAGKPAEPRTDVYAAGGLLYEMLTGKPPFEGDNFMEILHKKANSMPAPIGRDDVPPQLEELIFKSMAKEPAQRPHSMEELGRELNALGAAMFPGFNGAPPAPSEIDMPAFGVLGRLKGAAVAAPSGFYDGVRRMGHKQIAVVAGGAAVGLALVFIAFGFAGKRHKPQIVAVTPPPAALVAPAPPPTPAPPAPVPALVKPPEPAAAEAPQAEEAEAEEQADEPDEKPEASRRETVGRSKGGRASSGASAVASADNKKMLEDGERLLRAERFGEARAVFAKLAKSKRDRGPALIGLAEIAFQEKNYGAAVRSAGQATEHGGGAKARVLLGDAHFRMAHYREAAKAYEEALKLDPNNPSAKSGLALANKRM